MQGLQIRQFKVIANNQLYQATTSQTIFNKHKRGKKEIKDLF